MGPFYRPGERSPPTGLRLIENEDVMKTTYHDKLINLQGLPDN
jgi:hypothetical protein